VTRTHIPQDVLDAAHARSAARAAQDWDGADRLRELIESAGWKVVDRGMDFALSPAVPPDATDGDRIRYGSSASVPDRSSEPDVGVATVVVVATDRPADVGLTLTALPATAPAGTGLVVVADGPTPEMTALLTDLPADDDLEVVWTSGRLGPAAAANIGIRRAAGPVVILLDAGLEPTGDIVKPLVRALDDPTVAIAGGWGRTSDDLRRFVAAAPGDVDAIDPGCVAFRRSDAIARGPLDEHFRTARPLATWWSLVLRDEGEDATPRRAVRLADLPLDGVPAPDDEPSADPEVARATKRDRYRIIDRFGWRRDLLIGG
jgi:Glycosyl transferase family 2